MDYSIINKFEKAGALEVFSSKENIPDRSKLEYSYHNVFWGTFNELKGVYFFHDESDEWIHEKNSKWKIFELGNKCRSPALKNSQVPAFWT